MNLLIHTIELLVIAICAASIGASIGSICGFWLGKNYKVETRKEGNYRNGTTKEADNQAL